jgi:hypothetical protein
MMDSLLGRNNPLSHIVVNFDEQRRLASRHLNKITALQEELKSEERRLMQLISQHGLDIVSC